MMPFPKSLLALLALFIVGSLPGEPEPTEKTFIGKVGVDKATFIRASEKAHPPLYYVNIFLDSPAPDGTTELKALRVYQSSELQTADGPLEYGDRISFDVGSASVFEPMKTHPFSEVKHIHILGKGTQQERDFANRK